MAIRWDRLTVKAQEAMQRASELAGENGNPELVPLHVLAACWRTGKASCCLCWHASAYRLGVAGTGEREIADCRSFRQRCGAAGVVGRISELLDLAFKAAANFKDEYVSTEHLLLGLIGLKRDPAQQFLTQLGVSQDTVAEGAGGGARKPDGD